jgi:hypothetical protein
VAGKKSITRNVAVIVNAVIRRLVIILLLTKIFSETTALLFNCARKLFQRRDLMLHQTLHRRRLENEAFDDASEHRKLCAARSKKDESARKLRKK